MAEKKKPGAYAGYTEARRAANARYEAATVERISLVLPKGRKAEIKSCAEIQGKSVNGFINSAIDTAMGRNDTGSPLDTAEASNLLPPDTLNAAQKAAERTGESLGEFVTRSVGEQIKHDEFSFHMGINPATGEKLTKEA